jgi:hypothetical protein
MSVRLDKLSIQPPEFLKAASYSDISYVIDMTVMANFSSSYVYAWGRILHVTHKCFSTDNLTGIEVVRLKI